MISSVAIRTLILALLSIVAVSCSNNKDLSAIKSLIKQEKYEEAVAALDEVLLQDKDNKQAQNLRIQAVMLLKQQQRNEATEKGEKARESTPEPGKEKPSQSSRSGSGKKGFSIMSFAQDKGSKNISEITKKLSTN